MTRDNVEIIMREGAFAAVCHYFQMPISVNRVCPDKFYVKNLSAQVDVFDEEAKEFGERILACRSFKLQGSV